MVEGNSYTLAIIIILGLVAIFLIYWFAIRNKTCDNKVRQYENMVDYGNGEEDENEGEEEERRKVRAERVPRWKKKSRPPPRQQSTPFRPVATRSWRRAPTAFFLFFPSPTTLTVSLRTK